jgi:hypothetical protein
MNAINRNEDSIIEFITPKNAIHISNPLGVFIKSRLKFEHRFNINNSLSGSFTNFWSITKGPQLAFEYRHYLEQIFDNYKNKRGTG